MITEADCVGIDADWDRVYKAPDGGWIGSVNAKAANDVFQRRGCSAFTPEEYDREFGPVTP